MVFLVHSSIILTIEKNISGLGSRVFADITDHLTHISLASFLKDIGKQHKHRSDAASDRGLHCLHTECSTLY